ncbi:uncharacterized protein LOC130827534 [Amaranthus tricolor]|uniref:uncharacterized protein LOC130827534 n=1 Tax=Amaranthus tricolor TaxID=29722 RepID=UPI00258904B8|nr:uncharacterized protein LOC130827534 [Amaranthus tricolor]
MEGISAHVYKTMKSYWKTRGYQKLNKPKKNARPEPIPSGCELDGNPVRPRRRRFFRVKINRRIRIWKKVVGLPKKLLTKLRDAYVNMMLSLANSGLAVGGSGSGFGGSIDYGNGLGYNYRTQLKEYDEKMIVEIYKSLMIAQGQLGNPNKNNNNSQPQIIRASKLMRITG